MRIPKEPFFNHPAMTYNILHAHRRRNRSIPALRSLNMVGYRASRVYQLEIAANPLAGDLISGSGGCRKVRWGRSGMGKRGGARVIYFNGEDGRVWLLIAYAKAKFDNLPTEFLAKLKTEVEYG